MSWAFDEEVEMQILGTNIEGQLPTCGIYSLTDKEKRGTNNDFKNQQLVKVYIENRDIHDTRYTEHQVHNY